MTLLLFFRPVYHQGTSVSADTIPAKRKKTPKKLVRRIAETLDLPLPEISAYVDETLKREAEIIRLRQQELDAEAESKALLEQVSQMMRRAMLEKRRKLNMMIASILDWL